MRIPFGAVTSKLFPVLIPAGITTRTVLESVLPVALVPEVIGYVTLRSRYFRGVHSSFLG